MDDLNLEGKVIAVVDDHEVVLNGMRSLLETYSATVRTYLSGQDFLQNVQNIDCVVIDYYMPGLDGLALVIELRDRGYSIPMIILTGLEIPEELVAKAGISVVLDKAAGVEPILQAIQAAVGQRHPKTLRLAPATRNGA